MGRRENAIETKSYNERRLGKVLQVGPRERAEPVHEGFGFALHPGSSRWTRLRMDVF